MSTNYPSHRFLSNYPIDQDVTSATAKFINSEINFPTFLGWLTSGELSSETVDFINQGQHKVTSSNRRKIWMDKNIYPLAKAWFVSTIALTAVGL